MATSNLKSCLRVQAKGFVSMERYENEKANIERTAKSAGEYERRIKELCQRLGI